jgi:hypothetical protein
MWYREDHPIDGDVNMTTYPILERLFSAKRDRFQAVRKDVGENAILSAERVLQSAEERSIGNLEKIPEDGGSAQKFMSLLDEVRVAIHFAERGGRCRLLSDREYGSDDKAYTPDLEVEWPWGGALVEVRTKSDGFVDIGSLLMRSFGDVVPSLEIQHHLGPALSMPQLTRSGRDQQISLASDAIELAARAIENSFTERGSRTAVTVTTSGVNIAEWTGQEPWSTTYNEPDLIIRLFVQESESGVINVGSGFTSVWTSNGGGAKAVFIEEVRRKALRREFMSAEKLAQPYIFACVCREFEITERAVFTAVTGPRSLVGRKGTGGDPDAAMLNSSLRKVAGACLDRAMEAGWTPTLRAWGYFGNNHIEFDVLGEFVAGAQAADWHWAQEVSGILVLRAGETQIQWLPNPFCRDEICEPRLQDIGFSLDPVEKSARLTVAEILGMTD